MTTKLKLFGLEFDKTTATETSGHLLIDQKFKEAQDTHLKAKELSEDLVAGLNQFVNPAKGSEIKMFDWIDKWPETIQNIVEKLPLSLCEIIIKKGEKGKRIDFLVKVELKLDKLETSDRQIINNTPPFNLIKLKSLFVTIWDTEKATAWREWQIVDFSRV